MVEYSNRWYVRRALTPWRFNVFVFLMLLLLCGCHSGLRSDGERLNRQAYSYHYRDVGKTVEYARKVLALENSSDGDRAEAYNHLAFACIVAMDYEGARALLDSVRRVTDNVVELLIADIQQMRLCQRESRNKDFYNFKSSAERRLSRIAEEEEGLSTHERGRMLYARSEYDLVTSTYYYYVGLEREAAEALGALDGEWRLREDTAQYLAFLYNVGAGGIITTGSQTEINQQEFEYLMRCYVLAKEYDYPFWVANSMQALSEHLQIADDRKVLLSDNSAAEMLLNEEHVADSLLAGNLAGRSLTIFRNYGDVYQTAGAYRTLAQCYWELGDYGMSLNCLDSALFVNTAIDQAPDLVSSIREQMSVVYSALNDKPQSDFNRNIYLDLQEQTRQDRYLESRAEQLDASSLQLNAMIVAVLVLIVAMVVLLFVFNYLRRRKDRGHAIESLLEPLALWKNENEQLAADLNERYEEICEEQARRKNHILRSKRESVEGRAKVSLVNGVTPFIDRILHELNRLCSSSQTANAASAEKAPSEQRKERLAYVSELTEQINRYNLLLTEWIQLRQGTLNLHIESFALQPLFDMIARGSMSFSLRGITLCVERTESVVKADRVLTLFMINTIADNARKFTPSGGTVTVRSVSEEDYVEISVEDTGVGMSDEQLEGLFKLNVEIQETKEEGHGFGLLNCRGIIEKYRKLSPLFSVCDIGAESKKGKGSRFFFRLPKGVRRVWLSATLLLASLLGGLPAWAQQEPSRYEKVTRANAYADRAYYSNIRGNYAQTLLFADSARMCLNEEYRMITGGNDTLMGVGSVSAVPPEIRWLREGLDIDYSVITDIRNESAVAALALHEWEVYRYNNKIYTQLYKELSADKTLDSYVRIMQKSESNKHVAMIILVLLLLSIFPAYYVLYYRHRVHFRYCVERIGRINDILLSGASEEEKLTAIQDISTDRFPASLKDVVEEIKSTLHKNVESNNVQRAHVELAEDELHRYQLEDERLHVSNSVLDNCLSTLKHETMYYPSRIRQLVEGEQGDLQTVNEVASYYKELYALLSAQAMRQVESVKLECKPVSLTQVFGANYDVVTSRPLLCLLGDADVLSYLFEILYKQSGEQRLQAVLTEKRDRYVEIRIGMPHLVLSDEECLNLFTPQSMQHIPYLLCRQIVRDTGERTNARGCGIIAEKSPEKGTEIVVTLVKNEHI